MKYYPSERYRTEKSLQHRSTLTQIHAHLNCYNSLRVPCVKLLFFQSKHLKQLKLILMQKIMHFTIRIFLDYQSF